MKSAALHREGVSPAIDRPTRSPAFGRSGRSGLLFANLPLNLEHPMTLNLAQIRRWARDESGKPSTPTKVAFEVVSLSACMIVRWSASGGLTPQKHPPSEDTGAGWKG